MADKGSRVPSGLLARGGKLLKAGAKIVGRELKGKVDQAVNGLDDVRSMRRQVEQARDLVRTLGEMKGAAMKAGQLLSLEMSDLLPAEVVEILRHLHDEAPSLSETDIRRILAQEWGGERLATLEDLSSQAVAAASMGQVHSARIAGQKVALKIQYPQVAKSIDSDLSLLKTVVQGVLKVTGKQMALDGVFAELAAGLKQEADYRREAEALQRYAACMAADARFQVPRPLMEWCTPRVLCMNYLDGQRLKDWLAHGPEAAARQDVAHMMLDLLVMEFFVHGFVQTDPNYGNFLLATRQPGLVLLDCGAHQSFSVAFRRLYREFAKAVYTGDREAAMAMAYELALISERESAATHDVFWRLMQTIMGLFRPEVQPCRFGDAQAVQTLREQSLNFVRAVQYSAPPRQMLFLNRKIAGVFHLLKDLDASVDLAVYWQKIQKLSLADESPLTGS